MGNLLQNYFHGKPGKRDFTEADLPKDRIALFFSVLGVRWRNMFSLNLLYLLCWIPAAAWTFVNIVQLNYQLGLQGGTLAEGFLGDLLFSYLLVLFPLTAFTGPFTAGISLVTRNWARGEHSFVWLDFKAAMKENWKQALGLSAITSIMPLLAYLCWEFYGGLAVGNWFMIVPQMFTVMIAGVWFLAVTYAYPMLVTYRMSFGTIIKNSLLLAIGRLPMSVGVRLLHLVPAALTVLFTLLFNSIWVPLVLFGYYMLIGFALSRFTTASYTNAQFDKFINSRIEGAQVNRGLAEEDDEDYEDEEEERELKPWENGYASQDK